MYKCSICNHEFETNLQPPACPRCGSGDVQVMDGGSGSVGNTTPPTLGSVGNTPLSPGSPMGTGQQAEGQGCPWEDRERYGWVKGMWLTMRNCLLEPGETFSRMQTRGDMVSPLLYVVILGTIGAVFGVLWQGLIQSVLPWYHTSPEGLPQSLMLGGSVIVVPVVIVFSMFIGAAILHVCLLILGAGDEGFEATFRTTCYASGSTALFAIVPILGSLVGGVWNLVITIIGLHKMHKAPIGRVAVAYFLPLILCCGVVIAGMLALFPLLSGLGH